MQERRADWRTDIDDTYLLLLEFESGLHGTMTTELHQVAPFRELRVGCRRKSFYLDLRGHVLRGYDVETDSWCTITPPNVDPSDSSDKERIYRDEIKASADGLRRQSAYLKDWAADPYVERYYRDEIKAFVDDLEGRSVYPKSWADDRHLSNVLYAAEESSRRRAWVDVADVEDAYDGQSCVGG